MDKQSQKAVESAEEATRLANFLKKVREAELEAGGPKTTAHTSAVGVPVEDTAKPKG